MEVKNVKQLNLDLLIEQYLRFCSEQKQLSSATLKGYEIDLKQFSQMASEKKNPFDKTALNTYCRILNKKYKPRTVKRKLASLRAFSHWLEFEEYLQYDPFRKINTKTPKPIQVPRYLTLSSIKAILQLAYDKIKNTDKRRQRTAYIKNVRNAAILELLFATGLRVFELCSLKLENFEWSPLTIRVSGKGSKERLIPIENPEVIILLQEHMNLSSELINAKKYLFFNQWGNPISEQSVRNMVANYAKEAGISVRVTPHMIRHTFATLLLEQDIDIRYIQKLLGHSSIQTTEIYTSVTMIKERQIIATHHPRNIIKIKS